MHVRRDLTLPDESNMLELLVNNKIIHLDLPIIKVYDKVPTCSIFRFPETYWRRCGKRPFASRIQLSLLHWLRVDVRLTCSRIN